MRTQLLATFTTKKELDDTVKSIKEAYTIVFSKIYVLQNEDNTNELICTYNVDPINALNELIADFNNGVVDKSFPIPWENFKNMVLVTNSDGLSRIGTRIYKIINTET